MKGLATSSGPERKGKVIERMSFGKTTPILRIFNECKAKEFYVDFLGFTLDWEHRFERGLDRVLNVLPLPRRSRLWSCMSPAHVLQLPPVRHFALMAA